MIMDRIREWDALQQNRLLAPSSSSPAAAAPDRWDLEQLWMGQNVFEDEMFSNRPWPCADASQEVQSKANPRMDV